MTGSISANRFLRSLEDVAGWQGAHPSTVVILATALVAARADAEGSRYFENLAERDPADATAQALAGFFEEGGFSAAEARIRARTFYTFLLGEPQVRAPARESGELEKMVRILCDR